VTSGLHDAGVGPDDRVPVRLPRSFDQAAALLGVLRAGAAYVPVDPELPDERAARMLAAAAPRIVLDAERMAALPAATAEPAAAPADDAATPGTVAYVMFTSGSTGEPKGVQVPHRAIANRVQWCQARYALSPDDRVLHNASYAFDIAAWELFGPLGTGATVVIPREGEHGDPAALVRLLREERITVAHFVPSMLRLLLDVPGFAELDRLRMVFCGGESMDRALHDRFLRTLPGRTLAHFYGPTEAAISCLFHDCTPDLAPGPVPLGRPITGMRAYVLDDTLHPVPSGIPGEVFLGGIGLADGYLGRPDLTAARFLPDPFSDVPGARLYRTGDLARHRPDGTLEFLGRTDHQLKIRGHRIEPAEIEAALTRIDGIAEAVAVARGDAGAARLLAYVVAEAGREPPTEAELRAELRRRLPEAMVPAAIVRLDRLPLNANGKVDRAALPEPGTRRSADAPFLAPRTETEEAIAQAWQAVLRVERVGALDDFFELGGDSLLATQVVARLRSSFGIELPLRRFFEGSTVEALAGAVEEGLLERLESMTDEEAARELAIVRPPAASE
jgi:nonribosomal peptide synthetase DhbF